MNEGKRYNEGKLRYDLIQADALEGMVEVLTFGSRKYEDRNWEKGMAWSKVISSLKRHIAAYEKGEDYDPESGLLHADHIQCNAHFLAAYYRIYPQGDDRPHSYLNQRRIGLDIDDVVADCTGGLRKIFPEIKVSKYWSCPDFVNAFSKVMHDDNFWSGLEPKIDPDSLPFEPKCYITSRPCSTEITQAWLDKHGFPKAPVHTVGLEGSKVEIAKKENLDIFVDDRYENFVELNKAGICTFLMNASHNERYPVGHKRLYSLNELG
jgi:Uncharacterized conserved protein